MVYFYFCFSHSNSFSRLFQTQANDHDFSYRTILILLVIPVGVVHLHSHGLYWFLVQIVFQKLDFLVFQFNSFTTLVFYSKCITKPFLIGFLYFLPMHMIS